MIIGMKYGYKLFQVALILQGLSRTFSHIHAKSEAATLDDHNFLVGTLICAFLDSMESHLSLESNHMLVNEI